MRDFSTTVQAAPAMPADVRLLQGSAQALAGLAVLLLIAVLLAWAMRLPFFTLRSVRIEGDLARNSEATIRANAWPRLAGNFVTMDLREARAAFESVPWVRRAVVRRVWPMRLVVTLEEHQPEALWGEDDGSERLVNRQGEVFDANIGDVEDEALPRLNGPDGSAPQVLGMLRRLAPVIEPLNAGDIEQLALSPRGSWRLLLDKGVALELGRGTDDEVIARTQRFVRTLPQAESVYQRRLVSADLRHTGGFAVRLQGVTTITPPPPATPRRP